MGFKEFDWNFEQKIFWWLAYDTDANSSNSVAKTIADIMGQDGRFEGWTVKVASYNNEPSKQNDKAWMSYKVDSNVIDAEPVQLKLK